MRTFLLFLIFLQIPLVSEVSFHPFTAKVIKKKVRLRARPELDATIVRELVAGDLLVVDGEEGPFYQVRAPSDLKLYLFRTFVLDGVIEGNRVNVRLAPDLESPVVAQLNTGDHVMGEVSALHPKWIEITPPEQVRFFIAKDFLEEIGDEGYLSVHEKRGEEVKELFALGDKEREKLANPFETLSLDSILEPFQKIIALYREFEQEVALAQEAIRDIEQAYLLKKVDYLEGKTFFSSANPNESSVVFSPKEDLVEPPFVLNEIPSMPVLQANPRSYWLEIEKGYFTKWAEKKGKVDQKTFYQAQAKYSALLRGIIEPYFRPVKQKPGDFILVDPKTNETLAYIYATKYDLQDYLGQEVEFVGVQRPNNQFAHPAFFVLEMQCLEDSPPLPFGD